MIIIMAMNLETQADSHDMRGNKGKFSNQQEEAYLNV